MKTNNKCQGSKAARRRKEKNERGLKTAVKEEAERIINSPESTIEDVAKAMGVRLY